MASYKINLNNNTLPFTCFASGADICPDIKLNYDNWPQEVIAENIDDSDRWQEKMLDIFFQCLQTNDHGITFEIV
jgi:hypothetical protein